MGVSEKMGVGIEEYRGEKFMSRMGERGNENGEDRVFGGSLL